MTVIRAFLVAGILALGAVAAAAGVNIGVYSLAAESITTALSKQESAIVNLDGATAVSLEANFAYGSGGTSLSALAQTSCDGGTTWRDVARFDFTTATRVAYANLSGLTAKNVGAYTALGSEGVNDGLLCPQMRAVVNSVGTYANTTFSLRASVR